MVGADRDGSAKAGAHKKNIKAMNIFFTVIHLLVLTGPILVHDGSPPVDRAGNNEQSNPFIFLYLLETP